MKRTEPTCVDTKNSTLPALPITISVLPPPMSSTISGSGCGRADVAPRKVSRASRSPEIVVASNPKRSRSARSSSAPLAASRTALVNTATTRSAPRSSMIRR